jgi:hypothetical protein
MAALYMRATRESPATAVAALDAEATASGAMQVNGPHVAVSHVHTSSALISLTALLSSDGGSVCHFSQSQH